ncbi:hypothetical protein GGR57DRAFT_375146 [Xylariaceae sp. FL1272]|nr:hypothetical protein GGR57DRAFT_375146 [Xylariaceae sp. FL1272]
MTTCKFRSRQRHWGWEESRHDPSLAGLCQVYVRIGGVSVHWDRQTQGPGRQASLSTVRTPKPGPSSALFCMVKAGTERLEGSGEAKAQVFKPRIKPRVTTVQANGTLGRHWAGRCKLEVERAGSTGRLRLDRITGLAHSLHSTCHRLHSPVIRRGTSMCGELGGHFIGPAIMSTDRCMLVGCSWFQASSTSRAEMILLHSVSTPKLD